jgi:hypothetical protein
MNELKRTRVEKLDDRLGRIFRGLRWHPCLCLLGMVATMKHLEMASVLASNGRRQRPSSIQNHALMKRAMGIENSAQNGPSPSTMGATAAARASEPAGFLRGRAS